MVDKNLETEVTLELELDNIGSPNKFEISNKHVIDLIEQKRAADLSDKVRIP